MQKLKSNRKERKEKAQRSQEKTGIILAFLAHSSLLLSVKVF
jgi:hypothetical protein